jgi:hypothetical protein
MAVVGEVREFAGAEDGLSAGMEALAVAGVENRTDEERGAVKNVGGAGTSAWPVPAPKQSRTRLPCALSRDVRHQQLPRLAQHACGHLQRHNMPQFQFNHRDRRHCRSSLLDAVMEFCDADILASPLAALSVWPLNSRGSLGLAVCVHVLQPSRPFIAQNPG